jgi:hypothetical protein
MTNTPSQPTSPVQSNSTNDYKANTTSTLVTGNEANDRQWQTVTGLVLGIFLGIFIIGVVLALLAAHTFGRKRCVVEKKNTMFVNHWHGLSNQKVTRSVTA